MSINSHQITEDKITPKPSLGQTEQILTYHFSSTHLGDPILDSLWKSFLCLKAKVAQTYAATDSQVTTKCGKKLYNFNLLSTFFLLQPKMWLVFLTQMHLCSALPTQCPGLFLQNYLPNCPYTPCALAWDELLEQKCHHDLPNGSHHAKDLKEKAGKLSASGLTEMEFKSCYRKVDGCSTPASVFSFTCLFLSLTK